MQNHGDIRIGAVGRPQRDLLIEMYDRFEPLGAALGLPPREEESRREWIESALRHRMNIAAFSPAGAAVGHCFLVRDKPGSAEMAIFVRQEFRRRGVATALVKAVLEWGGVEGLRRVWTLTGSENTAALRLQEKFGFRLTNAAFYGIEMGSVYRSPVPALGQVDFPSIHNPHGMMDCIRHCGRRDSYADVDSGPALFRTATHQESGIHIDGGDLTGPRHWSDYGGIQRDLCRADRPLPLPRGGPHCADVGADQGRIRGNGQFESRADSATAASGRDREHAGDGLPRHDHDRAATCRKM